MPKAVVASSLRCTACKPASAFGRRDLAKAIASTPVLKHQKVQIVGKAASIGQHSRSQRSAPLRLNITCQPRGAKMERSKPGTGPDISQLKPHLQQQWDTAANAHLGDVVIKPGSQKKAQWVCDQCPEGHAHVWQAIISTRTIGSDCPYCSGRAVCRHNSLAATAPLVALDWDWDENERTPHEYTAGSGARVQWSCHKCQHKWTTVIYARVMDGTKCPMCGPLRRNRPQPSHPCLAEHGASVMQNWDWKRNEAAGLDPNKVTLGSGIKVHWICHKCPMGLEHRWIASPHQRFSPKPIRGCPYCVSKGGGKRACKCNSLQTLYPDIAAEWDTSRNEGTPNDYSAFSTHLAWWTSDLHGTWQQTIFTRTRLVKAKQVRLNSYSD